MVTSLIKLLGLINKHTSFAHPLENTTSYTLAGVPAL